jgi:hypothetical protein
MPATSPNRKRQRCHATESLAASDDETDDDDRGRPRHHSGGGGARLVTWRDETGTVVGASLPLAAVWDSGLVRGAHDADPRAVNPLDFRVPHSAAAVTQLLDWWQHCRPRAVAAGSSSAAPSVDDALAVAVTRAYAASQQLVCETLMVAIYCDLDWCVQRLLAFLAAQLRPRTNRDLEPPQVPAPPPLPWWAAVPRSRPPALQLVLGSSMFERESENPNGDASHGR